MQKSRYHKVSQSCGPEGICIAVNYWFVHDLAHSPEMFEKHAMLTGSNRYDMDFGGFHYVSSAFIRDVALAAAANVKNEEL